ncbi:MAG: hypothetical protein GX488_10935 [Clostridiales bacterium]|nr:hypothetical protein [Clostridiales bacterium]
MNIKNMIGILFALVMIGILATAALAVAPTPAVTKSGTGHFYPYYCIGNGVNVRSGPSTSYVSFGQLNYYDTFWHQMDANTGSFSFGKTGDDTAITIAYNEAVWGWVSTQYISWRDMI